MSQTKRVGEESSGGESRVKSKDNNDDDPYNYVDEDEERYYANGRIR